jgi:hypothetical protein
MKNLLILLTTILIASSGCSESRYTRESLTKNIEIKLDEAYINYGAANKDFHLGIWYNDSLDFLITHCRYFGEKNDLSDKECFNIMIEIDTTDSREQLFYQKFKSNKLFKKLTYEYDDYFGVERYSLELNNNITESVETITILMLDIYQYDLSGDFHFDLVNDEM